MATTPVKLEIKGFQEREVLSVDYDFKQATDIEGQISGLARGGHMIIRVKALNDGNDELLQWMLAETDPRDVKVTFENTVDGKTMKTLEGTGCYCFYYKEDWTEGQQHYEEIKVVCQNLKNGGVSFENPWN